MFNHAASTAYSTKNREKSDFCPMGMDCGSVFERFIHDLADGSRAAAALGAAAQAAIDLAGGARARLRPHRSADIMVAQNVARADDHEMVPSRTIDT
jgi:hypothetical protein